jgi:hypothetical protein
MEAIEWISTAGVIVSAFIGVGTIALAYFGLKSMREASKARERDKALRQVAEAMAWVARVAGFVPNFPIGTPDTHEEIQVWVRTSIVQCLEIGGDGQALILSSALIPKEIEIKRKLVEDALGNIGLLLSEYDESPDGDLEGLAKYTEQLCDAARELREALHRASLAL